MYYRIIVVRKFGISHIVVRNSKYQVAFFTQLYIELHKRDDTIVLHSLGKFGFETSVSSSQIVTCFSTLGIGELCIILKLVCGTI